MKDKLSYFVQIYKKFYPDYTYSSVKNTLETLLERNGKINAVTLDHYLAPVQYGGLGYGIEYRRKYETR